MNCAVALWTSLSWRWVTDSQKWRQISLYMKWYSRGSSSKIYSSISSSDLMQKSHLLTPAVKRSKWSPQWLGGDVLKRVDGKRHERTKSVWVEKNGNYRSKEIQQITTSVGDVHGVCAVCWDPANAELISNQRGDWGLTSQQPALHTHNLQFSS